MQKEPGRAGGQRPAAWPGGNSKKYAPKPAEEPEQNLLPGDKACTKTKRKGQKRAKKRFWRAKSHGLAAQRGIGGRSECGGGVCQPGGWLGCTLYAGSITEAAGAA
jgi:hypothetical protein